MLFWRRINFIVEIQNKNMYKNGFYCRHRRRRRIRLWLVVFKMTITCRRIEIGNLVPHCQRNEMKMRKIHYAARDPT